MVACRILSALHGHSIPHPFFHRREMFAFLMLFKLFPVVYHGLRGGFLFAKRQRIVLLLSQHVFEGWIFCHLLVHTVYGRTADHVIYLSI